MIPVSRSRHSLEVVQCSQMLDDTQSFAEFYLTMSQRTTQRGTCNAPHVICSLEDENDVTAMRIRGPLWWIRREVSAKCLDTYRHTDSRLQVHYHRGMATRVRRKHQNQSQRKGKFGIKQFLTLSISSFFVLHWSIRLSPIDSSPKRVSLAILFDTVTEQCAWSHREARIHDIYEHGLT